MTALRLAITAALLGVTSSQSWTGCWDPNDPEAREVIKIGAPTTICVTLGTGGNWAGGATYARYTWQPKADQYSRFHIPSSYNELIGNQTASSPFGTEGNITIHTASQNMLSFLRVYYDPKSTFVYPFLTAILDASKGVVKGIAWDDACVFCSKARCLENMYNFDGVSAAALGISPNKGCYFTAEECNKIHAEGGTDCDVTVYVVWTGTDQKGRSFQSSGKRFSAFPPARLQDQLMSQLPSFSDLNPLN